MSAHYVPYVKYDIWINNVVYSWHLAVTQSPLLYLLSVLFSLLQGHLTVLRIYHKIGNYH